jgi:multisubunit Na+/H+ antiporter MnhF subunit
MGVALWFMGAILVLVCLVLIRGITLSTAADRIVIVNAISTKVCLIIFLLAYVRSDFGFLDVAFVFVLCGFVGTTSILRSMTSPEQQVTSDYAFEEVEREEVV